ncbi:pyridoxamine 5'-phosphate oxidase family protein [Stappia sp. F7233]|uniref:nitric oxide dioxygenase n=1 Tax=Stappia albiluteola TaxID=2758565 RepID=A0A839ABZ2_9HYPH|nr:2Fe-2S iron-sulfur cluster-binding protein [Stappia albiluteola]MBA5777153.1 pyridoxamine 5'-phosphate oxidase family protein [Stappia albiluteola]
MATTSNDAGKPSPFHRGEKAIQERVGVSEQIETFGRMAIRKFMPDQHRSFFNQLPFIVLSGLDRDGWPRPAILSGPPGFVATPDRQSVSIASRPVKGDPFEDALVPGSKIGGLGIELPTRRRNRFAATVSSYGDTLELALDQSFGNCPQYIQTRNLAFVRDPKDHGFTPEHARMSEFDEEALRHISTADTFFIASVAPNDGEEGSDETGVLGADISHRGGKPGFVRIDDSRTLTIPDFAGNLFFNTFGNILLNPRTGLLFPDFATGDVLILAGDAEVIFEDREIAAFRGAERLLRFRLDHAIRLRRALPFRFEFGSYSPNSLITGDWKEASAALAAEQSRNRYRPFVVRKIVQESTIVRSFYLEAADDGGLPAFKAGQFLPIRVTPEGAQEAVTRTYTLSGVPGDKMLRISVKREENGLVSRHLHDHVREGDIIEALAPRGQFTIDTAHGRPVALIAGGIGVTPMISMLKHLVIEDFRLRRQRRIHFIHAARTSKERAFHEEVRRIAMSAEAVHLHFTLEQQLEGDEPGKDIHSRGRISIDLLKAVLPLDDYDFYICGPAPMMQSLYDGLRDINIADNRIHTEAFGPASLKRRPDRHEAVAAEASGESATVLFEKSGKEIRWTQASGTLLEAAEAAGLSPLYSCRSGSCGTCAARLKEGNVHYIDEPSFTPEAGTVLTCCARPETAPGSGEARVVLEI